MWLVRIDSRRRDTEIRDVIGLQLRAVIWATSSLRFASLLRQGEDHTHTRWSPPLCRLAAPPNKNTEETVQPGWMVRLARDGRQRRRRGPRVCTFAHVFTFPPLPPCPNYFYFGTPGPTKRRAAADGSAEAACDVRGRGQIGCTDCLCYQGRASLGASGWVCVLSLQHRGRRPAKHLKENSGIFWPEPKIHLFLLRVTPPWSWFTVFIESKTETNQSFLSWTLEM